MGDFLSNPGAVSVVLMLIWVPFAVGAYFVDVWRPRHTRSSDEKLRHPTRHTEPTRPVVPASVH
jgi:hypothetical protein